MRIKPTRRSISFSWFSRSFFLFLFQHILPGQKISSARTGQLPYFIYNCELILLETIIDYLLLKENKLDGKRLLKPERFCRMLLGYVVNLGKRPVVFSRVIKITVLILRISPFYVGVCYLISCRVDFCGNITVMPTGCIKPTVVF